ncbi:MULTISPECIES: CopG family ribbon-helix-helix protein [Sinorhizobium]|jgi:predicted transcriptional regulator|uniref:CopG family transcriptional regulator n=1 Tax=Rhizobium meliloti TaxID=382 RepID=A0A2J0Z5F3_RHIML|nr:MULTISPECIES: CopG family ribbon-helix-helix protein [Sinorhizobium]PJR15751.1 CopG family transcriptional regulator [Sinorhizobium meliloti]WEJ12415.1 CopG family ribbon-helix-helix protein [Sinorhizobium sp. M103]WEJ18850.1 CopG family ribbon-helix-helix protein [Sinorhizobium sp. K101]WEJ39219.1 CopG family ribbon-helix-helix protein [Sinorhizobium sp. C101]
MPVSTTMTIRVSPELKKKLDRIASATSRSRSFLAGEALAAYVDRELEIIDGIKRGMADAEAGRLVPHEEAMVEIFGLIRKAETGKGDKV